MQYKVKENLWQTALQLKVKKMMADKLYNQYQQNEILQQRLWEESSLDKQQLLADNAN